MRVNFFSFLSSSAWVGSLSFAFGLVVAPLGASLINRFGCRAVSMAGCLACASGLAVASFASSLTLLFVSYAVFGCGSGCVLVSSVVVVRRCFDKRQSLALGVSAAGQGLGTMVLSQVLQSLVTVVHWRDTLRIFAAALFLNSFCGILYDANLTQGHISSSSDEEEGRHRENSKSFTLHCSVWKVPGFLLLTACSFFFYVCSHYKLRPLGKIWALPNSFCKRSLPFLMVDASICNQAFRGRPFDF